MQIGRRDLRAGSQYTRNNAEMTAPKGRYQQGLSNETCLKNQGVRAEPKALLFFFF